MLVIFRMANSLLLGETDTDTLEMLKTTYKDIAIGEN